MFYVLSKVEFDNISECFVTRYLELSVGPYNNNYHSNFFHRSCVDKIVILSWIRDTGVCRTLALSTVGFQIEAN